MILVYGMRSLPWCGVAALIGGPGCRNPETPQCLQEEALKASLTSLGQAHCMSLRRSWQPPVCGPSL